jgi:hypothetical protein
MIFMGAFIVIVFSLTLGADIFLLLSPVRHSIDPSFNSARNETILTIMIWVMIGSILPIAFRLLSDFSYLRGDGDLASRGHDGSE